MQSRMPIVVAPVVAAGAAILLTNMYINEIRREAEPATITVMVATKDLTAGTVLEPRDIAFAVRYAQAVPKFRVPWNDEKSVYYGQELTIAVSRVDYILSSYFGGGARRSRARDISRHRRT